jgi:hypothetical protein
MKMHSQKSCFRLAFSKAAKYGEVLEYGSTGFGFFAQGTKEFQVDVDLASKELCEPIHYLSPLPRNRCPLAGTGGWSDHDADTSQVSTMIARRASGMFPTETTSGFAAIEEAAVSSQFPA